MMKVCWLTLGMQNRCKQQMFITFVQIYSIIPELIKIYVGYPCYSEFNIYLYI
ncbi:Uncharacterised protein [Sphingobacterium thalpophilum]|uniref:Uncharacterized protein n=1 Tax=Sphingobacterium thalpophilum TaxID=259 RepID=A0A4U9VTZ0_9SPHI|nr:Uncharacterised protein [Sphingobacterium thalpophilum]